MKDNKNKNYSFKAVVKDNKYSTTDDHVYVETTKTLHHVDTATSTYNVAVIEKITKKYDKKK